MTTLTRSTSRTTPAYRDYVNFLDAYKNGKKEEGSDSGVSERSFSLNTTSSSSSLGSDVTDFQKNSCVSFNTYLETSKNKKFTAVKPHLEENQTKKSERSEIFIEIQPVKSVSQVSKMFENKERSPPPKGKISSKINIFERQVSADKPKLPNKPNLGNKSPVPRVEIEIKPSSPAISVQKNTQPPPKTEVVSIPPPPPPPPVMNVVPKKANVVPLKNGMSSPPPPAPVPNGIPKKSDVVPLKSGMSVPPPPPPPMSNGVAKMQATLTTGPQPVKHTVRNPSGVGVNGIDRNDPMVKKLVYGTLRGLYGAYHDKANDMMATLPRDRVKKSNGVQDIIEKIASNGDLEKLNGRVNPKSEQE